jgi:WD40 repeat protein
VSGVTTDPLLRLEDHVTSVEWSPDASLLAAASLAGDVVVTSADGATVTKLPEHPLGALALAWSPDGGRLASGGQDGAVTIWDPSTGATHRTSDRGWVNDLAWRPDGRMLAVAVGSALVVLDPGGGELARYTDLPSTVTSLAWAADGRHLAAGCYGGVSWFEPPDRQEPDDVLARKGSILALATSPDGRWLASGNQDDSVHLWRLGTDDELEMSGYPAKIERLAWHPDATHLAVGSIGDVTVWDVTGKGPSGRKPLVLGGHERRITALSWSPPSGAGPLLAAASADGLLHVWDLRRSRKRPHRRLRLDDAPSCLAWRGGGHDALAVGLTDGAVVLRPGR